MSSKILDTLGPSSSFEKTLTSLPPTPPDTVAIKPKESVESVENNTQKITFKKRKKKVKSKQRTGKTVRIDPKKRKLEDTIENNNENNIKKININKISQSNKRRKLNISNDYITSNNENNKNNIMDGLSNKSNRTVLSNEKKNQGAVVELERENKQISAIEKVSEISKDGKELYRGSKNYINPGKDLLRKENKSAFLGIGPRRAPNNIRITSVFDYQPDICKDWKETGLCGYGDSCKFLHDRTDYKSGWEQELDWKKFQKRKAEKYKNLYNNIRNNNENDSDESSNYEISDSDNDNLDLGGIEMIDGLPFACYICRNNFSDPVKTSCNHYFCLDCIRNKVNCPVCGKKTEGSFADCPKLIKKLKKYNKL